MIKETKDLELKEMVSNTFLKTVSAFANYRDGEIKFGISDEGIEKGIENPDKVCLDIENRINDSIEPKPDFSFSINRRNNVITLFVKEGPHKPYLYKGKAYKRNDTASLPVEQIELKRLVLLGNNINFEELQADEQKFTFKELGKYFFEKLHIEKIDKDILRTLGFFNKGNKYNNAAALFADKNNFPGIDVVKFGENISNIKDRATFHKMSVLKQYTEAILMYRKYYQREIIDSVSRRKVQDVPEVAFREAVANALVHREWDIKAHIKVSMFEDRIEISSPGGLPYGISEEEYLRGNISTLRNPILSNVFFRLKYIEMFGTGIRRIIESYINNYQKPTFKISDNSILIVLPIVSDNMEMTTDEEKIYKLLETGKQLSSSEVAIMSGYSQAKTIRLLKKLKEKKYIRILGNGRGTKYTV